MKLKLYIVYTLSILSFSGNAQNDRYWSGYSSLSDNFSEADNWFGVVNPSSGDNLYFNNTLGFRHFVYSNYSTGSYFNYFISYNGAGGIKLYGDNTYAKKFENYNDENLLELSPNSATPGSREIGNRIDSDLEINPVGNGGILVSCDKISIDNLNGTRGLKVYGTNTLTINGVIFEKNGNGSTLQLLNAATVDLKGNSIFTGLTTVSAGTLKLNASGGALKSGNDVKINGGTLRIMQSQTIGDLTLTAGTLQIDLNVTLTITGTYSSTGGIINNSGTIKFAGGSVTFPGNGIVNNGTANTLAGFEVASSGTVTLNSLLRVTNSITVSSGTLLLGINDLRLNNASLNIATGATFDNGGENQIINETGGVINILGTFITRDTQGFIGTNTAIPSITPTLNPGSTIEYGLNGNQAVQGSRSYFNLTFSNSGTKTLSSAITNSNTITGTVTIKDAAVLDVDNKSFGDSNTNLTMTGTSEFKTAGTGVKPDISKDYSLGIGTKISFTNSGSTTLESIRLAPIYYNIDIIGNSVGTNTATGAIDFQLGGTLTVKSSGILKLSNTTGFSGGTQTSISIINNPTIILDSGSTIEYSGVNQTITPFLPAYSNLTISGTGIKTTIATNINIGNDLIIASAQLTIQPLQTFVIKNNLTVNSGGKLEILDKGSIVMINDLGTVTNNGTTYVHRQTSPFEPNDYTYWSTPIALDPLPTDIETTFTTPLSFPADWHTENSYEFIPANYLDADGDGFDDNHNDWSFVTSMTPSKGYIIMVPYKPFPSPQFTQATVVFSGKVNNGIVENKDIALTPANTPAGVDDSVDDFNLVGNPYPSAISADAFINANINGTGTINKTIDGTLYFWTHKKNLSSTNLGPDAYNYSQDDYVMYNLSGGIGTGGFSTDTDTPKGHIASGQGFFVEAASAGTVTFNNAMRVGLPAIANSQFYKSRSGKSEIVSKDRIWLNLENSLGMFSQQLIGYFDNATLGYDNGYDGLLNDGGNYVNFYSFIDNDTYKIQGRTEYDENDQVRLGYFSAVAGTFNINIDSKEGVFANLSTPVYLEDKLLNVIYDLKQSPYTFNTEKGTFNDRFILRHNNRTLGTNDFETLENQVLVSNKNKQIKVNSAVEIIDKVFVYDLLGRQIYKKDKVNSNELTLTNFNSSQQTLLVKVTLQNGKTVTRKVIY
jgi:autotransporter-associated beta strand protein